MSHLDAMSLAAVTAHLTSHSLFYDKLQAHARADVRTSTRGPQLAKQVKSIRTDSNCDQIMIKTGAYARMNNMVLT